MGVRGLQYYLEQCCHSASPTVSIPELLLHNRRNGGHEQPTIVVDGSSCIRILYNDLEWIGGGQLKQFGERAQHFVDAFTDIGVYLVFFFDGPTECRKRRIWVERRMKSQESAYHVLDAISRGIPSSNIDRFKHFLLPPGMGQLCRIVFKMCGCEVYQSVAECDEEIADYARNHQAFAILGQDTDFVILDGGEAVYLSMQHLNLQTMETRHYDPVALAHSLRIHPTQLPLLATFMGNDVIPFDDLKAFHFNIIRQNPFNRRIDFKILVPRIAMYIRTLPASERELVPTLPEIAERILGDPSRAEDILTSLHSYSPRRDYDREDHENSRWAQLVKEAKRKHRRNDFPSMIFAIMKGLPFESSTIMEDHRRDDLPAFATVTLPIRRRLYGILLQEKSLQPGEEHRIEEWCMAGPNSLDGPRFVTAEPPARRHPGLRALWGNAQNWSKVRWQLFVHSVSPQLDVERLRSMPAYLVIPTMILLFISEYLVPWEVDAMLATAACLKYYDTAKLASLPSDPLLPRGVRLSTLIMRTTFILYILLAACGHPLSVEETAPWKFFDGKLFQLKYRQAESGSPQDRLCENKVDVLEHFQMARQVVLGDDQ